MQKVYIIAEAGVNHNGDMQIAKKMIEAAAKCGADAVKFQTFKAEKLVSKFAQKAEYQKQNTSKEESQLEMIKKLELTLENHLELINHCHNLNIEFLSTPFDIESIKLLQKLNIKTTKIPSGEITNLPYLREVSKLSNEIILSTGMSNLKEIEDALKILTSGNISKKNITILHANTEYPTPFEDANLKAITTIKNKFRCKVGYSDHTNGIEAAVAAVALGALTIEKHFTLDKTMDGPDHKASLEPHELEAMIKAIRNIELALGNGIKKASKSETKNINIARKSIVASKDIKKGEILSEDNITCKRPGNGISPMKWDEIVGQAAQKDYKKDELI